MFSFLFLIHTNVVPSECKKSGWTFWMSEMEPTHSNDGDHETFDNLRWVYAFCDESQVTDVRCRIVGQSEDNYYYGQNVTCDKHQGLVCLHKNQPAGVQCLDYEISFACDCE